MLYEVITDTMNGYIQEGSNLTTPRNPITGTVFHNAAQSYNFV